MNHEFVIFFLKQNRTVAADVHCRFTISGGMTEYQINKFYTDYNKKSSFHEKYRNTEIIIMLDRRWKALVQGLVLERKFDGEIRRWRTKTAWTKRWRYSGRIRKSTTKIKGELDREKDAMQYNLFGTACRRTFGHPHRWSCSSVGSSPSFSGVLWVQGTPGDSVHSGNRLPLLALCHLMSLPVSTPLRIVNRCWSLSVSGETFNL